jgi:hypothetical protein
METRNPVTTNEKPEMSRSIKVVSARVLDAFDAKPQYLAPYDEDGQRRVMNPPHAWFILVTADDGWSWSSREDAPFKCWRERLEVGQKDYRGTVVRRAGDHLVFRDEAQALAALEAMEEKAAAILAAGTLDISDAEVWEDWWAGPAYGSADWEAHESAMEAKELAAERW